MKNRKLTYFLLPLSLIIWGLIIFKIYHFIKGDTTTVYFSHFIKTDIKSSSLYDTFNIIASYRDPFRSGQMQEKNLNIAKYSYNPPSNEKIFDLKVVSWPDIKYFGLISDKNKSKLVGLLKSSGGNYLVKQGDTFDKVTVKQIYNDSIVLINDSQRKSFLKTAF